MKKILLPISMLVFAAFVAFSQTPDKQKSTNPPPKAGQNSKSATAPNQPVPPQQGGPGMPPGGPPVKPGAPGTPPKMPAMEKAKNLPAGAIQFRMQEMEWKEAPATLPEGSKMMVLEGDPKVPGLFTVRIQLPAHAQVLPHSHPREERVTVVSGMVMLSFGEKIDTVNFTRFPQGSFYVNPVGSVHALWTDRIPAILQITGMGPWEMKMVENKDAGKDKAKVTEKDAGKDSKSKDSKDKSKEKK